MKKTLLTLVVGLVALGLAALPAAAGGNGAQSTTIHFSGTDEPFELGGCGLPDNSLWSQTFSGVIHTTEGPNGQLHVVSRFQGSVTVAVPGGQTYVGHYADRDAENVNLQNGTFTLTSNNVLHAPDGSTVSLHFMYRFIVSASGEVNFLDWRLTCGGGGWGHDRDRF